MPSDNNGEKFFARNIHFIKFVYGFSRNNSNIPEYFLNPDF